MMLLNSSCDTVYLKFQLLFNTTVGSFHKCSAVAEIGDRLATIDMGLKLGAVPFGGAGFPCNIMWPGPSLLRTKWYPDPSNRLAGYCSGSNMGV